MNPLSKPGRTFVADVLKRLFDGSAIERPDKHLERVVEVGMQHARAGKLLEKFRIFRGGDYNIGHGRISLPGSERPILPEPTLGAEPTLPSYELGLEPDIPRLQGVGWEPTIFVTEFTWPRRF